MQKSTLDSLISGGGGGAMVVGSEVNLEELDSLQTSPQIQSENGPDNYDDSITDIDLETHDDDSSAQFPVDMFPSIFSRDSDSAGATVATNGTNLMNLLNGNRKMKPGEPMQKEEVQDITESLSPSNGSTDQITMDMINKQDTIEELEKKVYKSDTKSVNLKNFLSWNNTKQQHQQHSETMGDSEVYGIKRDSSTSLNTLSNTSGVIESNLVQNHKRVSAKDLLASKRSIPEFKVTFRVDKDALAFYKKFENPLKTRGTSQYVRRKQLLVTLKIPGDRLKPFQKDFDCVRSAKKPRNANSVFSFMMKNSAAGSAKLTPLQKLKQLEAPVLGRNEFHIFEDPGFDTNIQVLPQLQKRQRNLSIQIDEPFDLTLSDNGRSSYIFNQTSVSLDRTDAIKKFMTICRPDSSVFSHLHPKLFQTHNSELSLWPQLFEPLKTESLLILHANRLKIKSWLINSFSRLKSETFKGPRKPRRRTKVKKDERLKDFIVDDLFDLEDNSDEDMFIPVMIIEGETGSGKTASVYTAVKEMDGYVYEINTSQTRSRRDLLSTLKELCTTHLIHKKDEEGDFQKGIVLLEDCDILFEQDRTFWNVVLEVLEISRRPIALTCTDMSIIPNAIKEAAIDNDGVLNLNYNRPKDYKLYKDYAWGCCYTQGYDLSDASLDALIQEHKDNEMISNQFDIRRLLLSCQMICQSTRAPDLSGNILELTRIEKNQTKETSDPDLSLEDASRCMDLLSVADNLESNAPSQLKHAEIKNEFIDIYYIDETTKLKQRMLPHELKISDFIHTAASTKFPQATALANSAGPRAEFLHNQIRKLINEFASSRSKPIPVILQGLQFNREGPRMTRSNQEAEKYEFWNPEPIGILDNSILNYLSPTPYILEVSPYVRNWCGFQLALDQLDKELATRTKIFLQWREFQNKSNKALNTIARIKS